MKPPRRLWLPRLILFALLTLTVLAGLPGDAQATPSAAIVEHLRMKVPAEARRTWLELELQIWDPWLRRQPGFLGRELLWDPQSEEGILLIRWVSRDHLHSIPPGEIEAVQSRFEQQARLALAGRDPQGQISHPFPLLHAGELQSLMTTGAAAAEVVVSDPGVT